MGVIVGFLICGLMYFVYNVLNGWNVNDEIPPVIDDKKEE